MSFCDPQIGQTPKSAIGIEFFFILQLFFLQNYKAQFFHLDFDEKPRFRTRILRQKIGCFLPCVTVLIVRHF